MIMRLGTRTQVLATTVISVSMIGTGIGLAATGSSSASPRAIHACVTSRAHGRTFHEVSAKAQCATGQSEVTWSITGPRGAAGQRGVVGPQGPRGASGLDYKKILTVSPGATPHDGGVALMAAVGTVQQMSPAPSATDPIEIFIEPGSYDLGVGTFITLPPYVEINGAGEDVTTISATNDDGVIGGIHDASGGDTVSNLTVQATEDTHANDGVDGINPLAGWDIDHVRVITVSPDLCSGNNFGIHAFAGPVTITDTDVTSTGCNSVGIFSQFPITITITGSHVVAMGAGAQAVAVEDFADSTATVHIADTELDGDVAVAGTVACVGDFTADFAALDATCQ
jgi:hypothetical protein